MGTPRHPDGHFEAALQGYEAASALGRERTHGVAIIAHTALDEIEVRRRLTDSEFDGYVQKGWPPGQLVALITKLGR